MARMKRKEDMTIEELQKNIAKLQNDIDAETLLLNEKKAAYETKKFQLIGKIVFDEMKNFKGNFFSLTPEILCKRLSDTFTQKGDKKIVRMVYSELGITETEQKTAPSVHEQQDKYEDDKR